MGEGKYQSELDPFTWMDDGISLKHVDSCNLSIKWDIQKLKLISYSGPILPSDTVNKKSTFISSCKSKRVTTKITRVTKVPISTKTITKRDIPVGRPSSLNNKN